MVGCVNHHLTNVDSRRDLLEMVTWAGLDVCGVTETWIREGRGEDIFQDQKFEWMGRERKGQRSYSGDGGVGMLVAKKLGKARVVKRSKNFDCLWVRLDVGGKLFIAIVYAPPARSSTGLRLEDLLLELESDIMGYRGQGNVIVMGDFNCRVGGLVSKVGNKIYPRVSSDNKIGTGGRGLVETMNNLGMVIMNGRDGGGEFTFRSESGKSVIDYIFLSEGLIPGDGEGGRDLFYEPKSIKVWEEYEAQRGDHKLITLTLNHAQEIKTEPQRGQRENGEGRKSWRRKGIGGSWEILRGALEQDLPERKEGTTGVEERWAEVKAALVGAQTRGMGVAIKKPQKKYDGTGGWDPQVEAFKQYERRAYETWKEDRTDFAWKDFCDARREKNTLVRRVKREFLRRKVQRIEELKTRDPREFWRQLKRLSQPGPVRRTVIEIKGPDGNVGKGAEMIKTWEGWFRRLLNPTDGSLFDQNFTKEIENWARVGEDMYPELSQDFTEEEVRVALRKLKNGKAVGVDEILGEALRNGGEVVGSELRKFFNLCLDQGAVPGDWGLGLIVPIFKGKGDRLLPDNYRGITLLSVVGKVFASVLSSRLMKWAETHSILAEEQGGFREDRSTVDQIFALVEVVRSRWPKQTSVLFIDVKKAYDSVWRDGLWRTLWDLGVRGRMWRILMALYEGVRGAAQVGDMRSQSFDVLEGLKQGCPLSCILFLFFINNLLVKLRESGLGVKVGDVVVAALAFADDVALLAEDEAKLADLCRIVIHFCAKWHLTVNWDKCAVLVFRPRGRGGERTYGECKTTCTCGSHWEVGGNLIKKVNHFVYLGVDCDVGLSFRNHKTKVAEKARGAAVRSYGLGIGNGTLSVKAAVNVWEALVRSVMEYGGEVWGEGAWEEGEQIQREMAKRILRVNKSAPNEGVLGELGWIPLRARRDVARIYLWTRILRMKDIRLTKKIYLAGEKISEEKGVATWAGGIAGMLRSRGLGWMWDERGQAERKILQQWGARAKRAVAEAEEGEWRQRMQGKKKLLEYANSKKALQRERYLEIVQYALDRKLYTELRLGILKVREEVGRWTEEVVEERKCMVCMSGEVETRRHAMLRCEAYKTVREGWWRKIVEKARGNVGEGEMEEEKWHWLMGGVGDEIIKENVRYVRRIMDLRSRME